MDNSTSPFWGMQFEVRVKMDHDNGIPISSLCRAYERQRLAGTFLRLYKLKAIKLEIVGKILVHRLSKPARRRRSQAPGIAKMQTLWPSLSSVLIVWIDTLSFSSDTHFQLHPCLGQRLQSICVGDYIDKIY
jgi:hypothetical protein